MLVRNEALLGAIYLTYWNNLNFGSYLFQANEMYSVACLMKKRK
jgi:hypothetical protein